MTLRIDLFLDAFEVLNTCEDSLGQGQITLSAGKEVLVPIIVSSVFQQRTNETNDSTEMRWTARRSIVSAPSHCVD